MYFFNILNITPVLPKGVSRSHETVHLRCDAIFSNFRLNDMWYILVQVSILWPRVKKASNNVALNHYNSSIYSQPVP